jgi:SAM-dependent methyltransferase
MNQGPPRIFDRKAIVAHRARAKDLDIIGINAGLRDRIAMVNRTFNAVVEIDHAALDDNETLLADAGAYDLVVGRPILHSVNDLPGVLVQIRRALKPDGLFVGALFGGDTLTELRQSLAASELETANGISPRVAPFGDVRDLGGLLQRAGFALPVADMERTIVRYGDLAGLVHDLRAMGETNVLTERSRKPMSRAMLSATAQYYSQHFADADAKLRATFDVVYLTGWAPHESQQQPLKPGSARARLADALGTTEMTTNEKPTNR